MTEVGLASSLIGDLFPAGINTAAIDDIFVIVLLAVIDASGDATQVKATPQVAFSHCGTT